MRDVPVRKVTSASELRDLAAGGELVGLIDCPIDAYHDGPGVSSSGLKEILKSPAHFLAYQAEERDSVALRYGRLAHLRILEPELYNETTIIAPKVDRRTSEGKRLWADFLEASAGRMAVSSEEHFEMTALHKAVQASDLARGVFSQGRAELSVYWRDEATGVLCRARGDYVRTKGIFDLKTTPDARAREFQRSVAKYRYHLSAAFYLDGFKTVLPEVSSFTWVAVEKTKPYGIGMFVADPEAIAVGRNEYRRALETYADCQRRGVWPGYEDQFVNLTLPAWYASSEGVDQ